MPTTPEILHSCPQCGRKNFTERGLKAHVCKGPKQALAVVQDNKPIDLDRLKNDTVSFFDPEEHGKRALLMIRHIEGLKKERAVKAILAGMYLAQVKAALGHGEFNKWCAKHLGQSKRSAERYMALAAQFSRSSKLLLPELVGANQLSLDLTNIQDDGGKAVLAKLEKFVGDKGLTELLQKYQIIKRGGNQRTVNPDPAPGENNTPEADEEKGAEEAAMAVFNNCFNALESAEKTLLNDLTWACLAPPLAENIEAKLKALQTRFHENLLKLKHELDS